MCVSGYIFKKIGVGRSLLNYFFSEIVLIIFPDFNKKHNRMRCIVCPKYTMKKGLFGSVT